MKEFLADKAVGAANLLLKPLNKQAVVIDDEQAAVVFDAFGATGLPSDLTTDSAGRANFGMSVALYALSNPNIAPEVTASFLREESGKLFVPKKYHFRYIALCGYPKSGKSEIQKILTQEFGIIAVDDGRVLRDAARKLFGFTEQQVTTQEGKKEKVTICGKEYEVRKVLGEVGNLLEGYFGDQVIPECTVKALEEQWAEHPHNENLTFSFGSVRKNQGNTYHANRKGVVVEIKRPGVEWSGNDFDLYDQSLVDCTFVNDIDFNREPERFKHHVTECFGRIIGA